jgi:hypothetical protein
VRALASLEGRRTTVPAAILRDGAQVRASSG